MNPARSGSNLNPQLHHTSRLLLNGLGALLLAFGGTVNAAPPNLTTGGVPNNAEYINLGPTGMEGWIYNSGGGNFGETAEARQIKVTKVDAGSPADGILAVNDVILGASGTGANPVAFLSDARKALAYAINDAEGRNPAVLKLIRWRAGVTTTVSITLEYLGGSYTATAPYNCPKSAAILEKGVNYIMSSEPGSGYGGFGTTVLMAVNDPSNPANAARQTRAQTEARALNLTQAQIDDMTSGDLARAVAKPWSIGPSLITQAEYYLQTGDSTVLPSIRARAIQIANGQSMFGTMGHHYALAGPNGEINGPYGIGYGPVNNAGMPCFIGLILAKKCGLTDPQITAGIDRAAKYFQWYADLGTVSYGENKETGSPSNNGKSGLAAIALGMLDGYERQSKYFAKISVYGASERDGGHTGPYFNHLWTPLGTNVGGQDAMARYFNQTSWLFDLARRWNGAFVYQAYYHGGIIVYGSDHRASWTTLLTYAAPLAKLHINGKSAKPALALNTTDMADINHAIGYNPATRTTAQLVQDLAHPLPQLHWTAGIEIGNNRKADHASILPTLLNMAQNGATFAEQHGALFALNRIADDSTAPVLAGLLMSPDSKVRRTAAQALNSLSLSAKTAQLTNIVNALIATDRPILPLDPQDPMHQDKEAFGGLLFSSSGIWGSGRVTTADRALLYPAFRIIASAPMGGARNHAFGVASYLTKTDVENLAEVLVEVAQEPPPAENNLRGSRTAAISAMQTRGFAEGVPLSVITFLEAFNDQDIPLGILEDYAGSSLTVQPDPKVPDLCQSLVKSGDFVPEAQAVLDAIAADQLPYKVPKQLTPFKRIDWVVADKPSLNLPAKSTMLRVQATDFANGTPIYTWRKVHGAGKVTFTPNGTGAAKNTTVVFDGTPGVYLFEVKMSDSRGFTEVYKTVQVTLRQAGGTLPPNSPPTANNQSLAAAQGTPTPVILTGADPEGYPLSYSVTNGPANGYLSGTAPHLVYTAVANYTGPDSITYQVQDSEGQVASATVNITVNTAAPVGLAIYESFDTPAPGNLNGTAGSSSIGLNGLWSTGASINTEAPSLSYGTLPVRGNKVKSISTNSPGGSRAISTSALAGRSLLDDGATIWVSMMLQGAGYPNSGRISIALANNGFPYDPNIPNDGIQPGSGLGVTVDDGVVYAAQFYDAAVGAPLLGNNDNTAGKVNYVTPRLVVAKITWGATSDKIEVYMPWEDMVLPAQPTSVLTANVNQSVFDTLTFSRGHNVYLDELRVGATYQSVVQGTVAMTADTTPPTPNPMSFAVAPVPSGPSSITMTATPAHDLMEVEYYFDCTAGAGGHDSGWQTSPVYTDTGLTPGVQYTYQVKTRDKQPALNETAASAAASATIAPLATVPDVVGILKDPAEDMVEAAGLSIGSITTSASYSLTIPDGHVLSQSPSAGTAAYGSAVDFVISIGQDPALPTLASLDIVDDKNGGPVVINTPMTYTLTFSEDIDASTLNAADFVNAGTAAVTIDTVTEISPGVVTVGVTPTGTGILRFAVAAGASISDAQGQSFNSTYETIDDTVVTIQLPSVTVPNVLLLTQSVATSAITSANLVVGTVNSIYDNAVAAGKVISQSPAGGSSIPGQHAVDLVLSLGPYPDSIRPLISSISPADNATDMAVSTNMVATFNENIAIGTGNITLKNLTDGTQTTIPITDTTQVSISSAVLTINPTALLLPEKNYAVRIDATAIKDLGNNRFLGILDDTTWNFRTADITPPAPNPMTFAVLPNAPGETSVTMTATTASDPSGVQYFFQCTAGGGHSSAWQDSPNYTDTGLTASTQYSYRVRARDKSTAQNVTAWSAVASVTTPVPDTIAPTPNPMSFAVLPNAIGETSITMTATTASDPSGVQYFFECTAGGGSHSAWQDSPTYTATGLTGNTPYSYRVRARDKSPAQTATDWSADASATTWTTSRTLYSSGAKTWNTSTANWGTVTGGPYTTATWQSGDTAILEGTAGAVALGGPISLKNLTINTANYNISGSTLNFAAGTITSSVSGVTIASAITGSPAVQANQAANVKFNFAPTVGSVTLGAVNAPSGPEIVLAGTTSGNSLASDTSGKLRVSSGTWTLTGVASAYEHYVDGGNLIVSGSGQLRSNSRALKLAGGTLHYNTPAAILSTTGTPTSTSSLSVTFTSGGNASLDNTSGSPITATTNPRMWWDANWTFKGSLGASSNLNLGTGPVVMSASRTVTVTHAQTTLTLGGIISGSAGFGLTKAGAGTLELRGANGYTGATAVSAGRLLINGNQSGASGNVTVAAGATLGGTGTIGGNTTIAANGNLEFNISTPPGSFDKLELADAKSLFFSTGSAVTITSAGGATVGSYTLLTAPGGIISAIPDTLNLPDGWVGALSISGNDLVLDITTSDGTAPTLVGIVDDKLGNSIGLNVTVNYTVIFNEDINAASVSSDDFGNASTSTVTFGAITETSPGVFAVAVTPTSGGTLQLQVNAGAEITDVAGNTLNTATALVDDTTITVSAINDAPVWAGNPVNEVNAVENANYNSTLADDASDANGNTLSFAKVNGPTWLAVALDGTLSGNPTSSNLGLNTFTVNVSDGIAPAVEATLNITVVVPVNFFSSGAKTWNSSAANWGTVTGGPYNTAAWSGGNNAIFEGTAGTVTLGEAISLKNLTINTANYNITGSTLNFTAGTITTAASASGVTIASAITGSPAVQTNHAANQLLTFAPTVGSVTLGAINAPSGPIIVLAGTTSGNSLASDTNGKLRMSSGTWTLTGEAYAYEHWIEGGNLIISTGTLRHNQRAVNLIGGTLHYNHPAAVRAGVANGGDTAFRIRGGSIDNTSGAAITTSTWNPGMNWEANWTYIGSNGAASNLYLGNGNVVLTGTRQVTVQNTATTLAFGGVISGSGFGLTKAGAGTLELRGASTYTGATTVAGGTLKLGANNVIPNASNVTIGTGTLDADIRTETVGTLDVNGDAVIKLGTGATLVFADSKAVDWAGGTLNITGTLGATSLRFGDSADDLTTGPGGQLARISVNGSGLGTYVLDANGYLVPGDVTPPTLASTNIVDNQGGAAINQNTTVNYTVTFSEDINATTVSAADFGNAGTSTVTFGTITETSPGVFTVAVTPTNAGTLQLKVNAGAAITDAAGNALITTSALVDDTTITVNAGNPYATWALGGVAFNTDSNGDGVHNGMAWLLGAANPSANALDKLPVATRNGSNLRLTFRCLKSSMRGGAVLKVQSSNDLGVSDSWINHEAAVPDADATVNGIVFNTTADGDYVNVVADIPAPGSGLFARLSAVVTP